METVNVSGINIWVCIAA